MDVTFTIVEPVCPSLVAVIVPDPGPTAVTRPELLTVATPGALVAHATGRPLRAVPVESTGVAVIRLVSPVLRLSVAGDIVTERTGATGGGGASGADVTTTSSI
jgi:hypothetical protein